MSVFLPRRCLVSPLSSLFLRLFSYRAFCSSSPALLQKEQICKKQMALSSSSSPSGLSEKKRIYLNTLSDSNIKEFSAWALTNNIQFEGTEILGILSTMQTFKVKNNEKLLKELINNQFLSQIEHMSPNALVCMIKVLFLLKYKLNRHVLEKICMYVEKNPSSFSAAEIVKIISLLPKLGEVEHKKYLQALCQYISSSSSSLVFGASEIAQIMNALANAHMNEVHVFLKLRKDSEGKKFDSVQLANIMNCFAKFKYYDDIWLSQLFTQIKEKRNLSSSSSSSLSSSQKRDFFLPLGFSIILNSLAKLRIYEEKIIEFFLIEIKNKFAYFEANHIALTLHAFAKFNVYDKALVDMFCYEIIKKIDTFSTQNMTMSLFALSSMNHYHTKCVNLLRDVLVKNGLQNISPNGLSQVYQVQLWLLYEYNVDLLPADQAKWLQETEVRTRKEQCAIQQKSMSSALHGDVAAVLSSMQITHFVEHEIIPGVLADIFLPDQKTVLEVDGQHHYFRNRPTRMLGFTNLRQRLVACLGLNLIRVPYFEWEKPMSHEEKQDYLRTKLLGSAAGGHAAT